jgi:hypothetical protein
MKKKKESKKEEKKKRQVKRKKEGKKGSRWKVGWNSDSKSIELRHAVATAAEKCSGLVPATRHCQSGIFAHCVVRSFLQRKARRTTGKRFTPHGN